MSVIVTEKFSETLKMLTGDIVSSRQIFESINKTSDNYNVLSWAS